MKEMKSSKSVSGIEFFVLVPLTVTQAFFSARAKNVILRIAGDCSSEQCTFARRFKGEPLALDAVHVGAMKSYAADGITTDSAPAASAFATVVPTCEKHIVWGFSRKPSAPCLLSHLRCSIAVCDGLRGGAASGEGDGGRGDFSCDTCRSRLLYRSFTLSK